MASTTVNYARGSAAFVLSLLQALLPALNAELTGGGQIVGAASPPFQVAMGDQAGKGGNWLTIHYKGEVPRWIALGEKAVRLSFNVLCQIHTVGNSTDAAFEMASQMAADHVRTVFDDDSLVLTPKVDAGLLGTVRAQEGERGPIVDLWPRKLADDVTFVRGWQMEFSLTFALKTR